MVILLLMSVITVMEELVRMMVILLLRMTIVYGIVWNSLWRNGRIDENAADPLADNCDGRIAENDGDLVAATLSQSLSWKSCERMLRKKMQNKEILEKFWCQLLLREDQAHPVYITASRSSYPCL